MKTIYYNNYRLICLIFMWCCVIPLYSIENMYYVYRVNTTQSYDLQHGHMVTWSMVIYIFTMIWIIFRILIVSTMEN